MSEDGHTAELGWAIEFPADQYSDVTFVELKPRPSSNPNSIADGTWKTYGVKACKETTGEESGTVIAVDGSTRVVARKEGGKCRGSSGIALLGDTSYKRLPNSKMKCR